jgi:tetratricopeptide (TPR) repeat protein
MIFGGQMDDRFLTWDDFVKNFGRELQIAAEVHERMVAGGLQDNCLSKFDFVFVSNKKEKLEPLRDFIRSHYPYSVASPQPAEEGWELCGATDEIPITADNLKYWALDMSKRGYEFDARFDQYGAPFDPKNQRFPDLIASKEDFWFDRAIEQHEAGDLSGALMTWSHVIAINPRNADAYYSRAIVKNEVHTWKAALHDYDAALEIAPNFLSALTNRGSLKDDNGDHRGAIADYDTVIELGAEDLDNTLKAYFNRGNAKLNLHDKDGACEDWKKALELGADYAQARIGEHCGR